MPLETGWRCVLAGFVCGEAELFSALIKSSVDHRRSCLLGEVLLATVGTLMIRVRVVLCARLCLRVNCCCTWCDFNKDLN